MRYLAVFVMCATIASAAIAQFTKLNAAAERAIKQAVIDRLKDPESARFSNIYSVRDISGALHTCGLVNARNSYGGYVGSTPFYVITFGNEQPYVQIASTEVWSSTYVSERCHRDVIAKINYEISEEKNALCKAHVVFEPGSICFERMQQCKTYLNQLNETEQPKFLNYCRRNGFESAKQKWYIPPPLTIQ